MQRRIPRPTVSGVLACVALFVALGGTGLALNARSSIPDGQGIFHACVALPGGAVRLVARAVGCGRHERAVAWNGSGLSPAYVAQSDLASPVPQSLSVHVPAGNYLASGNCTVSADARSANGVAFGSAQAVLTSSEPNGSANYHVYQTGTSVPDRGIQSPGHFSPSPPPFGSSMMVDPGAFRMSKAGKITLTCEGGSPEASSPTVSYGPLSLSVIPVASIHGLPVNR